MRKWNTLNYSILQIVEDYKSQKPYHPETENAYFKAIYNEAVDTIINLIQERFQQPGFNVFGQVEELFLKSVNEEDQSIFRGD